MVAANILYKLIKIFNDGPNNNLKFFIHAKDTTVFINIYKYIKSHLGGGEFFLHMG